ncbi:hypothetical protein FHX42_001176 [Saccharopolyspora lacisalsi]|uniref:Uncharacterized protein n=1 Tax=Halosaccharopolyspora lacisalsi TaxID=1000566 RepID=A0A839DWM1_9PSEU|nr:hypothetical protein [Halosaccharopolyspora lacisalsi]
MLDEPLRCFRDVLEIDDEVELGGVEVESFEDLLDVLSVRCGCPDPESTAEAQFVTEATEHSDFAIGGLTVHDGDERNGIVLIEEINRVSQPVCQLSEYSCRPAAQAVRMGHAGDIDHDGTVQLVEFPDRGLDGVELTRGHSPG